MIYCDTSLVIPMLVSEAHSRDARDWLGRQDRQMLVISDWVSTEVASALARKERNGELSSVQRGQAWSVWGNAFADKIRHVSIDTKDYGRATQLLDLGRRGLRASDALHLAIAERHAGMMATLDADLASAAMAAGLSVPSILGEA